MALRIITFSVLIVFFSCEKINTNYTQEKIILNDETFLLEIARTENSRKKGMQDRKVFPKKTGMIFVFPKSQILNFWMKNCFINIDIIYLDSQGRIVALYEMKQEPPRKKEESIFSYEERLKHYSSKKPVKYAIELPEGTLSRLKLKTSQKIALNHERLLNGVN